MTEGDTLSDRIKHARLALAVPLRGSVARERFGELVAAEAEPPEAQEGAYAGSTVKRWEEGAEPSFTAIKAIVALAQKHGLGYITLRWMAWGDDPGGDDWIVSSTEETIDPTDPGNGIDGVQSPPEKPKGLSGRSARGKGDRPVQKKPPPRRDRH